MKRALLLINPNARSAEKARLEVGQLLEKNAISVLESSEKDPRLFGELIERFKDKIDLVVIAGGDGSCLCVAEKLYNTGLILGIIPLGTANNLARSLHIPFTIQEAVQIIVAGNSKKIDLGLVNGKPFFNVTGMGLSTQVNRWVPGKLKKRWGVLAYVAYLFKMLRRTRKFRAEITCEGKTTLLKSLQITVCNGRHYGSGLTIKEDAQIDDHRLDLLSLHPKNWWEGVRLLPKLKRGTFVLEPAAKVFSGRKFTVRTSPILAVDTDGEITTRTPLEFDILPNSIQVFCPA